MRSISRRNHAMLIAVACFLVLAISSGCATRGFVRNEVGALRESMTERTDRLEQEVAEARNSGDAAMARAQLAYSSSIEAKDMALGNLGFREVSSHSIQFAFDSFSLSTSAKMALDEVVGLITERPDLVVDIYGFADPTGPAEYNLQLGQRRADMVLRYLASNTVGPMSRFAAISFGEDSNQRASSDLLDRAQQRRVSVNLFERTSPFDDTERSEDGSLDFD